MSALMSRLARCVLALGLLLTAAGCGGGPDHGRVTIMVPWSGKEFQAFYSVIKEFEKDTGIHVDIQVTRALTQQLDAAVAAGAPPDLAMLPSVGAIYKYADTTKEEDRKLQPLDVPTGAYLQPFRDLTEVRGGVYAVPVKVDVKSLVWYDSAVTSPPSSADARTFAAKKPGTWCLGLESGPTSGWPGADWIADILLAEGNGDAYKQWLSGQKEWNSAPVKEAWTAWRNLVGTSVEEASTLNFAEATKGMTAKPPTCTLAHGALSAMGFGEGRRYDFVTSSSTKRLEVSADFVGMFTTGNQSAEKLIAYLAGRKAQQSWVNQPGGNGFSADSKVAYDSSVQRQIARMLRPDSGYTLCFGAADAMTPDVSAAFYRAVLDYASDDTEDPTDLLKNLDDVQNNLGNSQVPSTKLCAKLT
ncbi:ABC transporter substrate-binding protein [Streptomyces sp. NPDC002928]|uniref:ABC transporter substrate-binding protein n=1 Tax=Streptomyces sp. NPDC002928 TaxID=3154440 RepID=UPI0033AA73A3